jgi:Fe-S-cluster containining protein
MAMAKKEIPDPMGILYQNGFDFGFDPGACSNCFGNCCRGESGKIRVNHNEILDISGFLQINVIDFIREYLVPIDGGYSIRERFTGDEFECLFFDSRKNSCSIYAQRPLQCRRFPFWDVFRTDTEALVKECPGVLVGEGLL